MIHQLVVGGVTRGSSLESIPLQNQLRLPSKLRYMVERGGNGRTSPKRFVPLWPPQDEVPASPIEQRHLIERDGNSRTSPKRFVPLWPPQGGILANVTEVLRYSVHRNHSDKAQCAIEQDMNFRDFQPCCCDIVESIVSCCIQAESHAPSGHDDRSEHWCS